MSEVLPAQVAPPEFTLSPLPVASVADADVVALPVLPAGDGAALPVSAQTYADAVGVDLAAVLSAESGQPGAEPAKAGTVIRVPVVRDGSAVLVLLVGVGDQGGAALRRAGAAVARAAKDRSTLVTTVPTVGGDSGLGAFVVGATLGSFGFHWRSSGPKERPVSRVVVADVADPDSRAGDLARAVATGRAAWRARWLASVPANLKTPQWLADRAVEAAEEAGLTSEVWDVEKLTRLGMGGVLAVGRAAAAPPCLVRVDYRPARAGRRTPRVVLVGKGITFDSGGLSIKPAESMTTMKRDMTGGAVVMSVLAALPALDCPVQVTGLIPAAENAISGDALRPGDVVTHYGGRTSEVTNTDAEGRLVLADALAYAVDQLQPAVLVDVATLTGAMRVALGQGTGGLFATHDGLAEAIRAAGEAAGEPLWRMPLVSDYEEKLSSKVADADNAPGGAGAITAALFLRHFTGSVPWAHLDIASAGDSPAERFEWTTGPTGFSTRALLAWLGSPDPLEGIA